MAQQTAARLRRKKTNLVEGKQASVTSVLNLGQLEAIEASVPSFAGRIDHGRIAAFGHSMGAQTVGMLLAARLTDPKDANARDVNLIEPRISVGVLLAATSHGGDDQSVFARANYSGLNPDFTQMTTQTRVVMDDAEVKAGSKPGFA